MLGNSDTDEDAEIFDFGLMAHFNGLEIFINHSSTSLVILDMSTSECKKTVEQLSVKMFNIHTSMTAGNEEITRLSAKNEVLNKRNNI